MSKFIIENPWNNFLEKIVINEDDKKVKELIVLKSEGHIHLFQSLPAKFQKLRDIVLCNSCEILISKRNCLIHSKFHENSVNKYLPYNAFPSDDNIYIPSRSKGSSIINSSNDKVSHNLLKEKKRKIIKKSKPSKHINVNKIVPYDHLSTPIDTQINENHINSNFIPKTIPNYRDPLKLKIRLQPKSASEKCRQKNENIFDNLNSYYDIKNHNQSLKSHRVRSMDELLNSDDLMTDSRTTSDNSNPSIISNDDEKSHLFTGIRRETIRSVFSAENILKMRRMDHTEEATSRQIRGLSPGQPLSCTIPIIAKKVVPISTQSNIHTKISPVLAQCRAQSVHESSSGLQTHNVFQPINNRIIRISNQRKCVRIQQVEDNPTNWQLSASEKVPSAFYNQEATQKQFQRRLIQQGMISENDIIRCSRSNAETDLGQRRKITIVNGLVSSNDPCIQVVRRTHPISRVIDTQNHQLPAQSTNQRNILYNKVVIEKNNPISIQSSAVHNPMSWSCQNMSNVELSDEEFVLDSRFSNNHYKNTNSYSSSSHNASGTSQYHSNIMISNDCSSNLSNIRSYPKSDPEIFSHTYQEDSMDPTIHFLPSPGSQIMGLPWDL